MKCKVGIETILDVNFGNRLQNFALQEVLNNEGYEVETIRDTTQSCLYQKFKDTIKYTIRYRKISFRKNMSPYDKARRNACDRWNSQYIKFSSSKLSRYHIPRKMKDRYNYYVTGSDQVWNPYFRKDSLLLLSFVKPSKRIAFSASFGLSAFPDFAKEKYANELRKFKAISVREESGLQILKQLGIDNTGEWIIDPTLMIAADEWAKYLTKPSWLDKEDYYLKYCLGSGEMSKSFIEQNGIDCNEVIEVLNPNNRNLYTVDPFEFLYLISKAKMVITDSFHATVFSILFGKPFVVFDRSVTSDNMNTRIDSLLKLLHLENRKWNSGASAVVKIDYSEANSIIAQERTKAIQFIRKNMPQSNWDEKSEGHGCD